MYFAIQSFFNGSTAYRVGLLIAVQFVLGTAFYFVASSLSYVNFMRYRSRFGRGGALAADGRDALAIRLAVVGALGNAVLATPFHYLAIHGYSRIYWDVNRYGYGYLIVSALLYLSFTETLTYWSHRALHTPLLFRRLHRHHHQFRQPTPWVSMAFHPLDSFLQAVPNYLVVLILPVHIYVYAFYMVAVMSWAVLIHDRIGVVRFSWLNNTDHHTMHHEHSAFNYGQFLTLWDRMCGTYRDPAAERCRASQPEGAR